MREETNINGSVTFTSNSNVKKLLDFIELYKNKKLVIMFKKGNEVYDEMSVEDINSQHLYYDIFNKELVFGNKVKISLKSIISIDRYIAGTESRFSIYYEVNRELFSVGIQNII